MSVQPRTGAARAGVLAALLPWMAVVAAPPAPAQEPAPEAAAERAAAAERDGDLSRAGDMWLELVAREPENATWLVAAARCLRGAGRFGDALEALENARTRFADDPDVMATLATTYLVKAEDMVARGQQDLNLRFQLEEAVQVAEAALRRHPGHRDLRLVLASAKFRLGDTDEALAQAEEIVRRFPDHHGGWILLGDIAYADFVALTQRLRGEQLTPAEHERLLALAQDSRDRATEAFERALRMNPDRAAPWVQLGNVLAWMNNVEQALVRYQNALSIDAAARIDHGWIAANAKPERRAALYEAAHAAYAARADAAPEKAAILLWWQGLAQLERKKYADAYGLFTRAAEANPEFENSHCYAMLAAYWQGEHDLAEQQAAAYAGKSATHFADHVRSQPDREQIVAILEFLSRRALDGGRLDASRDLSHVLAKLLDTSRHWNNYAFLCRETRHYEEALHGYENALALTPEAPQLLNDTAVVLQYHLPTEPNLERARSLYERAIARAKAILADAAAPADDKELARQALRDAQANLAKL